MPSALKSLVNAIPFSFTESEYSKLEEKSFLVILIESDPRYLPFLPIKEGGSLKREQIYARKRKASEPAHFDDIQEILNRRIETEYTTNSERKLREHLEELQELYSHILQKIGERKLSKT